MYGVGGSPDAISRDMNTLLFSSTFKHPSDGEFAKIKELISPDSYPDNHHQQSQQQESNLMRYRSAPSSFFANLIDATGAGDEDFLSPLSSNTEPERFFSRQSDSRDLLQYNITNMKQEESTEAINRKQNLPPIYSNNNHNMESTPFRVMNSTTTSSNLVRQSSSPAGFLSSLTVENGISGMRDVGKASSSSRLSNHISFSSRPSSCSRFMPQIAENGNESAGIGSPENGQLDRNDSWNESTFNSLKRNKDGDLNLFSGLNGLDNQNGDSRHYTSSLIHHMSLPKTSSEMVAIEKFLQFQQESVPCKIRAKRGYATHPRSIAERERRTRISERMRKLQELFPNMDKQTNTADMLDLAVEYVKDLQKEVQILSDTRARCTCLSKQIHSGSTK